MFSVRCSAFDVRRSSAARHFFSSFALALLAAPPVFGYPGPAPAKVDSFLYSGIFTVTLTY
jgi:hypothetical protein